MNPVVTTRYREDTQTTHHVSEWESGMIVYDDPNQNSINSYTQVMSDGSYKSREMHDNVTPQFTRKVMEGDIIMNDMMMTKHRVIHDFLGQAHDERPAGWYGKHFAADKISTYQMWSGNMFPSVKDVADPCYDTRRALIISRLHAQVGKAPYDYITSMAEFRKSVRTIERCARAAKSIFLAVKHKTLLRKRKKITAQQLASVYLEGRYGLRPLYYEVVSAVEALRLFGKEHTLQVHINDKLEEDEVTWVKSGLSNGSSSWRFNATYDVTDLERSQLFAGAVLRFSSTTQGAVDVLGFDNVLNSALELTKYSWLADRFINLFDWINSWTPEYGVEVAGTYVSVHESVKRKSVLKDVYSYYTGYNCADVTHAGTYLETSRVRRFGNPDIPWLPRVSLRLDIPLMLDILSIFGGYVTDFKRWKI